MNKTQIFEIAIYIIDGLLAIAVLIAVTIAIRETLRRNSCGDPEPPKPEPVILIIFPDGSEFEIYCYHPEISATQQFSKILSLKQPDAANPLREQLPLLDE